MFYPLNGEKPRLDIFWTNNREKQIETFIYYANNFINGYCADVRKYMDQGGKVFFTDDRCYYGDDRVVSCPPIDKNTRYELSNGDRINPIFVKKVQPFYSTSLGGGSISGLYCQMYDTNNIYNYYRKLEGVYYVHSIKLGGELELRPSWAAAPYHSYFTDDLIERIKNETIFVPPMRYTRMY